ncbi:MAG TPA: hypothetical protein VIM31_00240 [Candidatus Microsaccharimonas sp.]|jgi:glucan phosphoethanolaminetransferase (alkaline phosphatase superfamily)
MSIFPTTTPAPAPKTKNVQKIAIFYAVIIVVMVVAQLFTFDEFLKLVTSFGFTGGIRYAHFLAAFLVVAEVFALPFLLRMPLSTAFRWFSMILGWFVALIWLKISLWLMIQDTFANNVGFLGTAVNLMPGWWAVLVSVAFGILAAWASWGMWPRRTKAKRVSAKRQ